MINISNVDFDLILDLALKYLTRQHCQYAAVRCTKPGCQLDTLFSS